MVFRRRRRQALEQKIEDSPNISLLGSDMAEGKFRYNLSLHTPSQIVNDVALCAEHLGAQDHKKRHNTEGSIGEIKTKGSPHNFYREVCLKAYHQIRSLADKEALKSTRIRKLIDLDHAISPIAGLIGGGAFAYFYMNGQAIADNFSTSLRDAFPYLAPIGGLAQFAIPLGLSAIFGVGSAALTALSSEYLIEKLTESRNNSSRAKEYFLRDVASKVYSKMEQEMLKNESKANKAG